MMSNTMAHIRLALFSMGVSMPAVPDDFVEAMMQFGDGVFSSRPLKEPLYNTSHYIQECARKKAPDYLALGFDGYGMFSHYFHYYLVQGGRSIFLQAPVINESGASDSIAVVNEKLEQIARVEEQAGQAFSIVDVIDASYIVHGSIADRHARFEDTPAPLERYLANLNTDQGDVRVIRA